jgi:uncharacterized Zn-binding protein involved in type VI secretion
MGKIIITVGDMTTHGGTVLVGDPTILIEGKPVARIGSTIICPLCKIPTVIVQGATLTLVNNIPVARHGDPTSCGAKLVSTRAEPACTVHVGNNVHVGSGVVFGSGVVWDSGSGDATPDAAIPLADQPLHNEDWEEIKVNEFRTSQLVDRRKLNAQQKAAETVMKNQDRRTKEINQVLSSAEPDSLQLQDLEEGEKLRAFTSAGRGKEIDSAYWLRETDYRQLQKDFHNAATGDWDREGIKQTCALPCFNRANAVVETTVTKKHTAVISHTSGAKEIVAYSRPDKDTGYFLKTMKGGGQQLTPDGKNLSGATRTMLKDGKPVVIVSDTPPTLL